MSEPSPTWAPDRPQLTPMQWRILGQIAAYLDVHGFAPSLAEIAWTCGLASKSTALHHVRTMERLGMITRDARVARSIRVVKR